MTSSNTTGVTVYPQVAAFEGPGYGPGVNYPTVDDWDLDGTDGSLRLTDPARTGVSLWATGTWHHLDDHGTPNEDTATRCPVDGCSSDHPPYHYDNPPPADPSADGGMPDAGTSGIR